ncbi:membrane associated rhomboid family serine protease [Natronospira proteinivora]|uniref:Membrane associated rhomboid family serine protease n=1 Tax=Natronospira proteinivora TaxID=1807133 RepID=A0ABT1G4H1_9GAMM|nr:rhomboid family intramembrane serine protease [Natronospira proteinivora]MCP1726185.1 membrane associated rhomboid family serine protease [Natronospira proteinivora]
MASTPRPWSNFPPVVTGLMASAIIVFLMQEMNWEFMLTHFALWPVSDARAPDFAIWQLVSSAFLHGGYFHLFVNMLALWMFGVQIENLWGSGRFLFYYFFCVVGASLVQLLVATAAAMEGTIYPTVGASGGVFGILLAFGLLFPNQRVVLLIPPIPMKAKWFVVLFGAFSLFAGFTGTLGNIAHFAHLGGMVFGLILMIWWGWRPGRPSRW